MVLQRAYLALYTEPYRLPYLGTSQFAETRISDIMQFNHVIALTLDLLNTNKYIPKVVIIHTGQSDFGVMPQHLVKFFTAQMANSQGLNLKSATIQVSSCRGFHIPHAPWTMACGVEQPKGCPKSMSQVQWLPGMSSHACRPIHHKPSQTQSTGTSRQAQQHCPTQGTSYSWLTSSQPYTKWTQSTDHHLWPKSRFMFVMMPKCSPVRPPQGKCLYNVNPTFFRLWRLEQWLHKDPAAHNNLTQFTMMCSF